MISENQIAPDFTAINDEGKEVFLNSYANKKIVLYFYPKDDTPGCTTEANDFRKLIDEFEKLNTVILGVSKDDTKSHKKFKEKHCLPFTLLTDNTGKMCDDYKVWVEKSMYGKKYMGIERTTLVIDTDKKIKKVWNKVSVKDHAEEVLNFVKEI